MSRIYDADVNRAASQYPKTRQKTDGVAQRIQQNGMQQPLSNYPNARLRSVQNVVVQVVPVTPEGVANGTSGYPA